MVGKQTTSWQNVQELIDNGGNVSIGKIPPIRCAAVASDEHNMLVALLRREGEDITELLERLDVALEKAFTQEIYTDEINS